MGTPYDKYGPLNDQQEAERIEQMKKEQGQRTSAPVVTATPATPDATQTQTAAHPTATEQPARRSTADILSYLQGEIDKRRAESDEERKKREKREKTQAVIAGIADIGSAIGNMVHAYHGGKSTFDPTQGMSPRYKELWEKNKAEREKMAAERLNYMKMKNSIESAQVADEESRRQFDERMNLYREQEQRRKDEFEFKQQKETWRQDFEKEKLDQKAQLAKMNSDLKRWSERLKMSRSEVAHSLAGYTIDEYEYRDEQGRRHKVKVRTVYNPKTEQLETKETDEVQQSSQQDTQQSGGKSLGIGVQSAKPAGKSLGIKVK